MNRIASADPDPERVPRDPAPDSRRLAVGGRLVVLRGPELLGIEAEHDQQERQADRDERPGEDREVFHRAA